MVVTEATDQMNKKHNFISYKIFAADLLADFFELATDSAAALPEKPVTITSDTAGP